MNPRITKKNHKICSRNLPLASKYALQISEVLSGPWTLVNFKYQSLPDVTIEIIFQSFLDVYSLFKALNK